MAKTGKKTILLNVRSVDDIENTIKFAETKAKNSNLRLNVDYTHDGGLKLTVAGPKDRINIFEHVVVNFAMGVLEN